MPHRRLADARRVRRPRLGRRAALVADPLGEGIAIDRLKGSPSLRAGMFPLDVRIDGGDHDARVVDPFHAPRRQLGVEPLGLRERRDPEERPQTGVGVDGETAREPLVERQPAGGDRLDAARPLRLGGGEADQPAVDPELLARRAGVDAGVLDPTEQPGLERRIH